MNLAYFKANSLKVKVTLATFAIFLTSIWGLTLYASRVLRQDMQQLLGEQQFSTARLVAGEINDHSVERLDALEVIAATIAPILQAEPGALQQALDDKPVFHMLFNSGASLVNSDGALLAVSPASARQLGRPYLDGEGIVAALKEGKASISKVRHGQDAKERMVVTIVPVRNAQGKVVGALSGVTAMDRANFLDKALLPAAVKGSHFTVIASQPRTVVTSSDPQRKSLAVPARGVNSYLDRNMDGYEGYGIVKNILQVEELASIVRIPATNWYLYAGIPTAQAFAPVSAMQQRMLLAAILLTLLAGVLVWLLLHHQLAPLFATMNSLASLEESAVTPQLLPVVRKDELGLLISSFNWLLQRLGQNQAALRQSEKNLAITLDSIGDGVIATDAAGRVTRMNPVAETLCGWKLADAVGRPLADVFHILDEATREPCIDPVESVVQRGRTVALANHTVLVARAGQEYKIADSAAPIRNPAGANVGMVLVFRDVTERYRADAALQHRRTMMERAESMAHLASFEWDAVTDVVTWSPEMFRIFGRDPALGVPNLGRQVELYTPESTERLLGAVSKAVAEGTPYELELTTVQPDGEQRPCYIKAFPECDASGRVVRLAGLVQDITERKKAERETEHYRDQLEALVAERTTQLHATVEELAVTQHAMDQAGMGVYWVDADTGRFLYANQIGAQAFGFTQLELLAKHVADIDPHFEGDFKTRTAGLREAGSGTFETSTRGSDGNFTSREVTYYFRPGKDGGAGRFINIVTDITQRKKAEQELRQALVRAEAATTAKSSFLANMSHEIRTPLNGILGMASLLRLEGVTQKQADRLNKLSGSAQHLLSVINSILDLSKIEAGKLTLEELPLSISDVVRKVVAIVAGPVEERGLHLLVDLSGVPANLTGDPTRLHQALLNYANNAVKFTSSGSVTLGISTEQEDDHSALLRFEVKDTGVGIAPEAVGRLFQAFEQADNSMTRKYGGTGLGLAITKRLAELMGGAAGVESTVGQGSTFWFTARLKKGIKPKAFSTGSVVPAESVLRSRFAGARILLVDDEPTNREVSQQLLEAVGLVVDSAEDGLKAVALAQATPYAAILMDVQMPGLNGLDATRQIRRLPGYGQTPVIAMTANVFVEDKVRCTQAGMDEFLAKPFAADALFATVLKCLDAHCADRY